MGDVFLDAFIDTLLILPFLLVMNFAIELIEYKSKGLKADRILKGGAAPLIGTAVGIVPQCGFSVVATELYGKRKIALGTLLAVYLATSDEAIPIMLSDLDGIGKVWQIIVIKICFALIVGYSVFAVEKLLSRKKAQGSKTAENAVADCNARDEHADAHAVDCGENDAHVADCDEYEEHTDVHDEHEHDGKAHLFGCHHHDFEEASALPDGASGRQKAAHVWKVYLKHPLIHTGTVILFIFIVNVLFGTAVHYVGEEKIEAFMRSTGYLQPVLAGLVGLIPNCAASVVITEMYVVGGLNLGAAAAGLCVSAGIGYAVLIKQNRPIVNTVLIIVGMYVLSVTLGICITACGF